MFTDQTRNLSLTAELNSFIRTQVASGRHRTAGEAVRAGLRRLQRQHGRDERRTSAFAKDQHHAR
ncbi:type II toxin-antitoxin system ParD family antitoxin [Rubellimicrobium roseum]|uniref:Type II toxin-antitoxin system ParD family antitoxin n=1 Tax=Rubellimicrobium roseum TaxID=687525 RepID=A0A5C4NBX9_9RHOB|nr:type II toxin-antitoxin system ParD family antitoxin [Rubellimicrobium roseum]